MITLTNEDRNWIVMAAEVMMLVAKHEPDPGNVKHLNKHAAALREIAHRQQVGEVQGDAREQFEAWAKSAGLKTKIYAHNDMHSHPVTRGAWMAWQHLAARQPVAQVPVGTVFLCPGKNLDKTQCNFMRKDVPEGTALYAAPPAQGTDLGVPQAVSNEYDEPEECPLCGRGYFNVRCTGCGYQAEPTSGN